MAYAAGVQKKVVFIKEVTYGLAPADTASNGEYLRRVETSVALSKDTYQSSEIRSDYQIADFRHGVKRVGGNMQAELSLGSFEEFFAALLRKDFVAGTSFTAGVADEITVASPNIDFVDTTNNAATLGFRVGDVIRVTTSAGTANARITSFADVGGTNDRIVVAEDISTIDAASDDTATVVVRGKKTWMPLTGHTSDSFTIEHHHSDTDDSRLFTGCHITSCGINMPPTGLATLDFGVVGKDMAVHKDAASPFYTGPASANTASVLASVNGTLRIAGADVAELTGLDLTIETPWTGDPVVGSDTIPCFFPGRSMVSGQFTAYFSNESLLEDFIAETEREMHIMIDAPGAAPNEFFSIFIPRLKIGSAPESDGEGGLIQTMTFQALLKQGASATGYDDTTIVIQDSTLV